MARGWIEVERAPRAFGRGTSGGLVGLISLVAVLLAAAGPAAAQSALDESVAKQKRPDFDAIGVQPDLLGSFVLFPKFISTINYDDNVFRSDTDERSDFFYTLTPALVLRSDWDNHALNFAASGTSGRFFDNTSEDFDDFSLSVAGRLDIALSGNASASLSHNRKHESRGSPDDVGGAEPTVFFLTTGTLGARYRADQIELKPTFKVDRFNFRDNDGTNNDDRDLYKYSVSLRAGYEAVEGTLLFVEPSYNLVDYDDAFDDNGFQRDSDGYTVEVGLNLDYSGVSYLEFAIGFLQQNFDDPRLENVDGLFGRGQLTWNPTDISTLTAEFEHTVDPTTLSNSSATVSDAFDASYDHELLDNLLINLDGGYENLEFAGISRQDQTLNAGISVKYLMNANMSWELGYDYVRKNSNEAGQDFSSNVALLKLVLQL